MPKVKMHKARTDVYNRGIRIPDEKAKSGFRSDKSQPADENDTLFCKKGDTYYAWGMMMGGRGVQRKSLTPPTRSQLTNSDFLGAIYDLEDNNADFSGAECPEDLQSQRDELVSELQSLGEEQSDKYSNLPEGFQQGQTGELLEQRAEACSNIADEYDNIDLDYEEPDEDEIVEELAGPKDDEDFEMPTDEAIEAKKQEHLDVWLEEKKNELGEIGWDYE